MSRLTLVGFGEEACLKNYSGEIGQPKLDIRGALSGQSRSLADGKRRFYEDLGENQRGGLVDIEGLLI
jgi:hypothetical protein